MVKKNHSEFLCDSETGEVLETGTEIQYTKDYGVGIDCHSRFLQISVLVKNGPSVFEYRNQFDTDWQSVVNAKEWVVSVIETNSSPFVHITDELHYCIESTSVYHVVVLKAWEGIPSVINPSIAGASKKKTDVLDAKMLAVQDLTGIWPSPFIPSSEVDQLRLLLAERDNFNRLAARTSNRINNSLLKFGYTVGRDGSVTKNTKVREMIEDQISDDPSDHYNVCPEGIPENVKCVFIEEYMQYDMYRELVRDYDKRIRSMVCSMNWETADSEIPGRQMLKILCTAPGIGEQTAILWLAKIVTPRRFRNEKALATYCSLDPSLKVSAGKVTSTVKRGGCKDLHSALCVAASNLVRRHNEPFGRWGYNIAVNSGRWKKGISAVARKLAVALYFMSLKGEEFSYEKYRMMTEPAVIDISIEELANKDPAFRRYVRILISGNIHTAKQMVHSYYLCDLTNIKGLGKKFYGLLKEYIGNQEKYRS
jgi:transposase